MRREDEPGFLAVLASAFALSSAAFSSAAFSAPFSSLAASISRADSRSTAVAYLALRGLAVTVACIAAGSVGAISDSGARSRVHATGVGAPRSFMTVTIASPMPRPVITSPRSS